MLTKTLNNNVYFSKKEQAQKKEKFEGKKKLTEKRSCSLGTF